MKLSRSDIVVHDITCMLQDLKNNSSDFVSAFKTQYDEFDYWITDIKGEVSSTLRGTLFRNGPGRLIFVPVADSAALL